VDDFAPEANWEIDSIAVQPDGKILVGGIFGKLGGAACNGMGRLNADGTLDTTFSRAGGSGDTASLAVQSTGAIWAGGPILALLEQSGAINISYTSRPNRNVATIVEQADGKILIGGSFTMAGGQARNGIARLNADGSLDQDFDPGTDGTVLSLAVQTDGKIVVGGAYSVMAGGLLSNLGRLNPDGSLDSGFTPGTDNQVTCVVVQADGKVLVGGNFSLLNGQEQRYIGRLNADGTLDADFQPTNPICSGICSLAVQADGRILVAGFLMDPVTFQSYSIGRLNPDGSLDSTFQAKVDFVISAIALQADGKVLVGGWFSTLAGQPRTDIGRLYNNEAAASSLTYDGSAVTWLRGGSSPEVWRSSLAWSADGTNWVELGEAARIDGGWQLAGVSIPAGAVARARGWITGAGNNGSSWFVESQQVVGQPAILCDETQSDIAAGQYGFGVSGMPGQVVAIQASPDLRQWTTIGTTTLGSTPAQFMDPAPPSAPARFYRLLVLP
jgi:uncharacterized delta-60 repeat protein